jgi:hypothetical protein
MTQTRSKIVTNGATEVSSQPMPDIPPQTMEDRVGALEETVSKIAAALASVLAQQMQPQLQQSIFDKLTSQSDES